MLKSVQEKQGLETGSRGWLVAASRQMLLICQACQKLKCYANWSTIEQNRTTGRSVTSWLELATQSSRESALFWKNWLFTFHSHTSINIPFTHERNRASRENFERETLEKNNIDSSPIFIKRLFNSSTLFLSIFKSLRGLLPKPFLTISIYVKRLFGALGSS